MTIKFLKSIFAGVIFVFVIGLNIQSGCNKSLPPSPTPPTIASLINTGTNFTILKAAMQKANLETLLNGNGNFTVFAPTNNAFGASNITAVTISTSSVAAVTELLKYHVVSSAAYKEANFPAVATAVNSLATANNTLYLKLTTGLGAVNGQPLGQSNIVASNGVLHVLNNVLGYPNTDLGAPTKNLFDLSLADTSLKLFRQAINKTIGATTDLKVLLTGTTAYTVFAPTNNALKLAGFDSTVIANTGASTLVPLLQYHMLNNRVFTTSLEDLAGISTLNATVGLIQPRVYKVTDIFIGGNGNSTVNRGKVLPAAANYLATNGVLHTIDRVILP
jgi:uncharacterized surface protein with fasciclin (FAS1) repeats